MGPQAESPRSSPSSPTSNRPPLASPPTNPPNFQLGAHKSCDACKARKVKCPNAGYPKPCGNCVRRKETCCFGKKKVPRRNVTKHLRWTQPLEDADQTQDVSSKTLCYVDQPSAPVQQTIPDASAPPSRPAAATSTKTSTPVIPTLYLDHVLARAHAHGQKGDKTSDDASPTDSILPSGKVNSIFGGSYRLTYFTESRLASLSGRLRNHKVDDLVRRINGHIRQRLRRPADAQDEPVAQDVSRVQGTAANAGDPLHVEPTFAAACIRAYFETSHQLFPFLDRATFEAMALPGSNPTKKEPFLKPACTAWRLFARGALAHFADLHVLPEDSLLALQALTAMSVYGLGVACLSIERVILTEAARRAQSMAQSPGAYASAAFQRTFWILYGIEKTTSFHFGRSSMFVDTDLACPFPAVWDAAAPDAWPLVWIRHARLLSRTYTSLFSVGTACNASADSLATIDQLRAEVEAWRVSVPLTKSGLRPDASSTAPGLRSHDATERLRTLGLRYMYHSVVLVLSHAQLHHLSQVPQTPEAQDAHAAAQDTLVVAARAILELTPLIEVEPHTPLWMLAVVPLMALLVLFDRVVHAPPATSSSGASPTSLNLVLLDMGAGYFSRIEYASGGSLPGSLLSEFAHIARDYVNDDQRRLRERCPTRDGAMPSTAVPTPHIQQPLPSPPTLPQSVLLSHADMSSQLLETMPTASIWSLPTTVPPGAAIHNTTPTVPKEPLPSGGLDLLSTADMATFNNDLVFAEGNRGPSSRESSVYGVNLGYWNSSGNNHADLAGTDVMGLFTSNYYFLPDMDGILYGNYNGM